MKRLILALSLSVAGCGGSLKHTIDDNTLASATPEERSSIRAVRDEGNGADDEFRSAQNEEKKAENDLSLAANELKSAKLAKDSAKLNRQGAEASGDLNRKNRADRDFTAADKAKDAADAKVEWLERRLKFTKRTRQAAEAHVDTIKARIELEKAKLAQAKGIRPSEKFNVMDFEQQSTEKQQKYNDARRDADEQKTIVDDKERRYITAQQGADAARSAAQGM